MTTLVERARSVRSSLIDRRHKEVSNEVVLRLVTTAAHLEEAHTRLDRCRTATTGLADAGLAGLGLPSRTLKAVADARTKARTVATILERSDQEDLEIVRSLEGKQLGVALETSAAVAAAVTAAVRKSLVDERVDLLPADIERPIPEIPGLPRLAYGLNRNRELLSAEIELTENNLGDWERIQAQRQNRHEARAAWDRDIPILEDALTREDPEVRSFLQAASSEAGAPLSAVTAAVLQRLAQDNLLDDFRVRST